MKKRRILKIMVNGVSLAALAALGITAFQMGTAEKKNTQEIIPMEALEEDGTMKADEDASPGESEETTAGGAPIDGMTTDGTTSDGTSIDGMTTDGTTSDGTSIDGMTTDGTTSDGSSTDGMAAEETTAGGMSAEDTAADGVTSDGGTGDETAAAASGTDILAETEASADMAASVDTSSSVLEGPELSFSEDTLMEWPVNGNILVDYSMDQTTYFATLDQYKLSPAIAVQAVEGAPVVSAVNGTVYSIEEDVRTGTTVTMELGNGYQAIYGQLKDLSVAEGDTVTKGTTIGYISAPTRYYSREGSNLYFAMKKDGKPIDPITYLP